MINSDFKIKYNIDLTQINRYLSEKSIEIVKSIK